MKFHFSLISFLLLYGLATKSQVQLSGQVKDAQTRQNLEFCNVAVYNMQDSLIAGAITNAKGYYFIPVQPGQYKIIVSFIGYTSDTVKKINVFKELFYGIHKLQASSVELKGAAVTASSKESKIDRDEQIVTEELKKNTTTSKEVLDKLNGVDLDHYSGKIKVDNSDKVIILVDGLEKDQEYVKNLAPDRMKKVEVIRDPGGKYGIEGYSAVINITLRKDYQGTELFIYNHTMADADAKNGTNFLPSLSSSITFNYIYNNLNFYVRYGNWFNDFWVKASVLKSYSDGRTSDQLPYDENKMNGNIKNFGNWGTLGCDVYLNPKHTLSYEGSINYSPFNSNTNSGKYKILNHYPTISYRDTSEMLNYSKDGSDNNYHTFYYIGKYNENNELTTSITIGNNNSNNLSSFQLNSLAEVISQSRNNSFSTTFYSNYTHTFKNKSSFQFGIGNTLVNQKNVTTTEGLSNEFKSSDIRNKLFAYYFLNLSQKISVKFGGVGEISQPEYNNEKRQFSSLQPYADMKIKPLSFLDFKAKYRTRYNYPGVGQTAPYTVTLDNTSVRTGNPALTPEATHRISLQATILDGFIRIEPFYHFSNNMITDIGKLRPDGIFEYTYDNSGRYLHTGWEAGISIPLGKILIMQNNFEFYKSSINSITRNNSVNDWSMTSQVFYYNENKGTVAGIMYQRNMNRRISTLGWDKQDVNFWMLLVQQAFFKKRLSVMVGYFLPVDWAINDFNQGNLVETDSYREEKLYDVSILKNFLMFEISYRFNKGKSVKNTEKMIEKDGEGGGKKGLF